MRNGGDDGGAPDGGGGAETARPDVSPAAVNERLAAFVAGQKAASARGEALRECDLMLAEWAEDALRRQQAAEMNAAIAEAGLERMHLDRRGGRLQ
jgi:hypothetical protein